MNENMTKAAEFQLNTDYSHVFESNIKSSDYFQKISNFKFDTTYHEDSEERKRTKLRKVCGLATLSARLAVTLYSDASKPDNVSFFFFFFKSFIYIFVTSYRVQKHVARDMIAPFSKHKKSMFDEILLKQNTPNK